MTVLVTGAIGLVGPRLLRRLRRAGAERYSVPAESCPMASSGSKAI